MKLNLMSSEISQPHGLENNGQINEASQSFSVEKDGAEEKEWESYLDLFEDASLYQSWSYGRNFPGGRLMSHIVLRKNGEVRAVAQARILTIPLLQRGISYVFMGPLWKRKGFSPDKRILSEMLRVLNNEYVKRRKLLLRVVPVGFDAEEGIEEIFNCAHYRKNESYIPQRTLIVDLEPSVQEIRSRFHHKWRNRLNVAERNGLEVFQGTSENLFRMFKRLYEELLQMKEIPVHSDIENFIKIQGNLPQRHKMHVLICQSNGRAVAGLVGSLIGNTGICLLSAANSEGRELLGTYLLQWELLRWLKEQGAKSYDLGGIDPEKNPGGYRFKAGLSGRDVRFPGQFESCWSMSSRIIVNTGEYLRRRKKKL
ncbi:MAG TPA: peptidoglycan bridge formation glycyltransferase FemA/FemB family protein [Ignavibacteriales bacterium]|nr:peptidoglycan bridge formation glycyltransferase FemA/FemB family protein [Ignavibacteriales bacterium]